jgi:hypothetical protein
MKSRPYLLLWVRVPLVDPLHHINDVRPRDMAPGEAAALRRPADAPAACSGRMEPAPAGRRVRPALAAVHVNAPTPKVRRQLDGLGGA